MQVEIRAARDGDASQIADIYAPFVRGSATSFEAEPPSPDEIARRVRDTQTQRPWIVCASSSDVGDADDLGDVLGYAYATAHRARLAYRWSAEVSVYVAATARRGGVGRRLYRALFDILARQGYINAYAGITLPNPASVGLHEAVGFRAVGVYHEVGHKLGAWHDVGWWELRLTSPDTTPGELRAFPELRDALDWSAF